MLTDITQYISGHNHLINHQHRIGKTELNTCQYCDEFEEETAHHIICFCPIFSTTRMEIFGESPTSMSHIYSMAKSNNDDLKILGKYLKNYYEIR